MVVSEGAPVPPAQVAADASGSQRPRSRPAGTAAGIWTAWQPSVHPRRESCTGLGATAATSTVRAAPTAACAEHGMRLLGVPDRPGEPARTAVSRLGEKRVAAEEAAAVQVDATGPAQFPRGAEQVADAADGADAAARLRRRKQHVRRCSPLSSATDRCLKPLHAAPSRPGHSSCRRPWPTATPYGSSYRSAARCCRTGRRRDVPPLRPAGRLLPRAGAAAGPRT